MNRPLMQGTWMAAALALSCATVPPPVTDSPDSPASPSADQAAWDPEFRYLETEADADSAAHDAMGHDHEGSQSEPSGVGVDHDAMKHHPVTSPADEPTGTEESYLCPTHPEVSDEGPGTCPICGMTLEPERSPESGGGG